MAFREPDEALGLSRPDLLALAYDPGNFLRRLVPPRSVERRSLPSPLPPTRSARGRSSNDPGKLARAAPAQAVIRPSVVGYPNQFAAGKVVYPHLDLLPEDRDVGVEGNGGEKCNPVSTG